MVAADRHRCLTRPNHRDSSHGAAFVQHALGMVNNGIITVALIGSVSLLVATLASHEQAPLSDLPENVRFINAITAATGMLKT